MEDVKLVDGKGDVDEGAALALVVDICKVPGLLATSTYFNQPLSSQHIRKHRCQYEGDGNES